MDGELSVNKGMLFENMVAQELVNRGCDLWFTEFSKKGSKRKYEVDFILPGRAGIIPLEVKSGKSTPHSSLDYLMKKYAERIEKVFVIHSKDVREEKGIAYLPIYMMPFIPLR
jgi:predicted AAA+ superfamily ATPase